MNKTYELTEEELIIMLRFSYLFGHTIGQEPIPKEFEKYNMPHLEWLGEVWDKQQEYVLQEALKIINKDQ